MAAGPQPRIFDGVARRGLAAGVTQKIAASDTLCGASDARCVFRVRTYSRVVLTSKYFTTPSGDHAGVAGGGIGLLNTCAHFVLECSSNWSFGVSFLGSVLFDNSGRRGRTLFVGGKLSGQNTPHSFTVQGRGPNYSRYRLRLFHRSLDPSSPRSVSPLANRWHTGDTGRP